MCAKSVKKMHPGDPDPDMEHFYNLPEKIYHGYRSSEFVSADALCWLYGDGKARLSTEIVKDLYGVEGPAGLIGHYEALDEESGIALLHAAQNFLFQKGIKILLGPMNGSTWERYRLALPEKNPAPFFFSEPINPPDYPRHFESAGFLPADFYESRATENLAVNQEKFKQLESRIKKTGTQVQRIGPSDFENLLEEIYVLSVNSFSKNLYYRDIPFARFRALYAPLKPFLDPDFVQAAFDRTGNLTGIILGFPDLFNSEQLVFKTLAVSPEARGSGLGIYLFDLLHMNAKRRGCKRVVHALMHCENVSRRISEKRTASFPIRRYAIFKKTK